jgi:hypothetical protein
MTDPPSRPGACFPEGDPHGRWLRLIGMPATPTFAVLSGLIIGYCMGGPVANDPRNRRWLVDRGLFLMIVCHPLLYLSESFARGVTAPFHGVFITDVIGLCLLLAPPFRE